MKNLIIVIIIILVIVGIYLLVKGRFYTSGPNSTNTSQNQPVQQSAGQGNQTTTPENQQSGQTPTPQVTTVTIKNFAFNPSNVTVAIGTTIEWINQDTVTHSIKSGSFNSQNLNPGDSFEFTFTTAGMYNYSCGIHPFMTGKIIVQQIVN